MKTTKLSDYQEIKKLGEGSYGEVFLMKDKNNEEMALKKFKELKEEDIKEIIFLQNIDFPNIVKIKDIVFDNNKLIGFTMKYYPKGNMYRKKLSGAELDIFWLEMLSSLNYLHTKGIVHADLKLGNIVADYDNHYLIDFGSDNYLGFPEEKFVYSTTPGYCYNPECSKLSNNINLDMFNLAVCVIELILGHTFYKHKELRLVKNQIISVVGLDGYLLIEKMMGYKNGQFNTNEIISAITALNDVYFDGTSKVDEDFYKQEILDLYKDVPMAITITDNNITNSHYIIITEWMYMVLRKEKSRVMTCIYSTILLRTLIKSNYITSSSTLQMHACSCMYLASNLHDSYNIMKDEFVYLSANSFTEEKFDQDIINILKHLNWKIDLVPYRIFIYETPENKLFNCLADTLLMYFLTLNSCQNDFEYDLDELSSIIIEILHKYQNNIPIENIGLASEVCTFFDIISQEILDYIIEYIYQNDANREHMSVVLMNKITQSILQNKQKYTDEKNIPIDINVFILLSEFENKNKIITNSPQKSPTYSPKKTFIHFEDNNVLYQIKVYNSYEGVKGVDVYNIIALDKISAIEQSLLNINENTFNIDWDNFKVNYPQLYNKNRNLYDTFLAIVNDNNMGNIDPTEDKKQLKIYKNFINDNLNLIVDVLLSLDNTPLYSVNEISI